MDVYQMQNNYLNGVISKVVITTGMDSNYLDCDFVNSTI
jgi:hypothetical protein